MFPTTSLDDKERVDPDLNFMKNLTYCKNEGIFKHLPQPELHKASQASQLWNDPWNPVAVEALEDVLVFPSETEYRRGSKQINSINIVKLLKSRTVMIFFLFLNLRVSSI